MNQPASPSKRALFGGLFSLRNLRRGLLTLAILATVTALFYTEENWRGKHAWENFKKECAARGQVSEWKNVIPPPVPDDENFFKAPNMQKSFVGRGGNDFSQRMSFDGLNELLLQRGVVPSVDVTIVPANTTVTPGDADLVLDYHPPLLSLTTEPYVPVAKPVPGRESTNVVISSEAAGQISVRLNPGTDSIKHDESLPKLTDVNGWSLGLKRLAAFTPRRMIVRTDSHPSTNEVRQFIPAKLAINAISTGDNIFRVSLGSVQYIPAVDFLAWSDSFQDQFDALRAALDRPYARMDGDYSRSAEIPIPNFVCARATAQMLALRAQCYLLLGEPDKALRELTLVHHMSRIFEGLPTSRPMTLIAAMINVAVKGLYVNIIGDGLRLQAWHDPQLAALQQQLAETDLLPYVQDAFQFESMSFGWMTESTGAKEIANDFAYGKSFQEQIRDPNYIYVRLAPRGWLYQNAVTHGHLELPVLGAIDPTNHLVFPKKVDAFAREIDRSLKHRSPFTFLANASIPNFTRAYQTAGHNQTLVNEAFIACALERYRWVRGHYPDSLDELIPQYADKFPHDVIGGGDLKYRGEGGTFVLYSIGWNERDDGGTPSGKGDRVGDLAKNDWVWPYQ